MRFFEPETLKLQIEIVASETNKPTNRKAKLKKGKKWGGTKNVYT